MTFLTRRQACGCVVGALLATGCTEQTSGPEEIRYGREVCEYCGMIISEARYAVEIRGPRHDLHKFDDLGDALCWFEKQSWKDDPAVEFWVMDSDDGKTWLEAHEASFVDGVITPMNWGWAAVRASGTTAVGFEVARAKLATAAAVRCGG